MHFMDCCNQDGYVPLQITYEDVMAKRNLQAARIKELESAIKEWISVNDRLPDIDNEVLGYFNIGTDLFVGVCILFSDGHWSDDSGYRVNTTHWMPLPEPPKP